MKRNRVIVAVFFVMLTVSQLWAHCEIPCGIYNDKARIVLILEHITTIEKAMNQINTLSAEGDKNYNQLIRWVVNKEEHATELQHIVTQYFMTQRIKLPDFNDAAAAKKYNDQLAALHTMLVHAMKAKQTTDQVHIDTLRKTVDSFVKLYFSEEDQKHLMEHHQM